ncbi:MAG: hypothetical protein K6T83_03220 [Alicyclobacillus sp.]|nr:hypothetical protein [Alicyclobacillus sp.]
MPLSVNQYTPKTKVIAHTWRGETYDLTGEIFSWSRGKNMNLGQFTLNLVPRKDKNGLTWADKLKAMDYVEIRASKTGRLINGELPIIIRGFVDGPAKNTQFSQRGGPSEPRIVVTGTDYTKLFNRWQILYLFTQNILQPSESKQLSAIVAQDAGFGMFANYNIPLFSPSINAFASTAFKNIVDPMLRNLKKHNYPSFEDLTYDFAFPNYPMNGLTIASYTGSYWNLFQYISSPPFGELFIRDEQSGPVLIGRMTPYKTITGETPKHGNNIGNAGDITDISSINVTQTDQDLYTYFLTWAADGQLFNMTMPTFLPGLSNGVMTKKAALYGVNPLQIDTPWVSVASSGTSTNGKVSPDALQMAADLNAWAIATLGDNELFWSGTITCHGDESYQVGTYRTVKDENQEFYLTGINDIFYVSENPTWTATLQVVRGIDLG